MVSYSFEIEPDPEFQLGISFEVSQIDIVKTPTQRNVWNQFDEHGLIAGLSRNKGETNWEYRRRIYDTWVNIANSTYTGLINGITRELGLELYYPIRIDPKVSSATNQFFAPDPYIKFDGVDLYLYSDYKNDVLDHQIDRWAAGGNYEKLKWLVSFINSTTYFEASLTDIDYQNNNSMVVINQSNRITYEEPFDISTKIKLKYGHIVPGSILIFGDQDVFKTEVANVDDVTAIGRFHIDYRLGIVTTYSLPALEAYIRYDYISYPFTPVASPIMLCDLNSSNFNTKLFNQILLDDGTYENGLPTELGVDLVNELLAVVPMYWGT